MRSKRAAEPHERDGAGSSDGAPPADARGAHGRVPLDDAASAHVGARPAPRASVRDGAPPAPGSGAPENASPPAKARTRSSAAARAGAPEPRASTPPASAKKRASGSPRSRAEELDAATAESSAPGAPKKRAAARNSSSPPDGSSKRASAPRRARASAAARASTLDTRQVGGATEPARWVARESNMPGGVMPYEPSAPCAACARGVDPLRAACISVTEHSVHYFCSRSCRESYLRAEAEHEQRLVAAALRARAEPPEAAPVRDPPRAESAPPARRTTLEPVARRVAPSKPSTPLWPLLGAALCAIATFAPVAQAAQGAAFALLGLAIVFASRTPRTRADCGLLAWLAGPLAVGLLGLAALLGPGSFAGGRLALLAACAGVVLLWLREHLLERAIAARQALHSELSARLSTRVQVSLPSAPGAGAASAARSAATPASVERSLDSLREGDELLCEVGSVIPVDGIVSEGSAEVLPYPRARTPLERRPGGAVLAGALVVNGTLRVRALRVGAQRALFAVLGENAEPTAQGSWSLAVAAQARSLQAALAVSLAFLMVALLSPQPAAAKLASAGAALLALPSLALARGLRNVLRAATERAAARGVRFRDAAILERAGGVDTAVLRVEGVLVPRAYTLVQIVSLSDTHDANALLALAFAAGCAGEPGQTSAAPSDAEPHPIARAVRAHAQQCGVAPAVLRRITLARGLGVSALTDGQGPLVFGSRAALLSAGVSVAAADSEAQRAESSGQRVVFLALGGRVRGLLVFAQTVRAEARASVQTLFDLGLELTLVSGDHRATVDSIARTLDLTQVKAELSASQRAAEVSRLCDGEAHVVALGQAPADEAMLTSAELSLCLDAAGQPHHHEAGQAVTYDITTATDDLRDAVAALVLARRARRALRRVLAIGGLGLAAGLLGAFGLLPPLVVVLLAAGVDLVCLAAQPGFAGRRWGAAATREEAAA